MKTTVLVCAAWLLFGSSLACSSKDEGTKGAAGSSSSGGSGNASAGSSSGGSAMNGAGTGGGASDACLNAPIVCVDATTASTCNPNTGMDETFNCATDAMSLGFVSNGCMTDAVNGDHCTIDEFQDQECLDGTAPWGVCHQFTEDSALDIYVTCFLDEQMLRAQIVCYAKYYDEATNTLDCVGASAECDAL